MYIDPPSERFVPDTKMRADTLLEKMCVPRKLKGFCYLRSALCIAAKDPSAAFSINRDIYPAVADEFGTAPGSVECAIRRAIERAWMLCDPKLLYSIFKTSVSSSRGRPTDAEYIAVLAGLIRLDAENLSDGV